MSGNMSQTRMRALRMILWMLAMCATSCIVAWYWPHKVIMVPPMFLAIMVPTVLLPLHPKSKQSAG